MTSPVSYAFIARFRKSSSSSVHHWEGQHRFEHWYRDNTVYFITRQRHSPRRVPFWRTAAHRDYFDGCIRDEVQCRRAYRYTLLQGVRARQCSDWRDYRHTRMNIELERDLDRAKELNAFLEEVPYRRYQRLSASIRANQAGAGDACAGP